MLDAGQSIGTISLKAQPIAMNLTTCACCGSQVNAQKPLVDLNTNTIAWGGNHTHLEPKRAELMATLVGAYPNVVLSARLLFALWGNTEDGDGSDDTLKVHITRTRQQIAPLGLRIVNVWGQGYKLVIGQ